MSFKKMAQFDEDGYIEMFDPDEYIEFALDDEKNKHSNIESDASGENVEENCIPLAHQQSHSSIQDMSGFFCQCKGTDPMYLSLNHSASDVTTPSLGFLPDRVDVVASSHGLLICQGHTGDNTYYACNPATKNWKYLPEPKYYHGTDSAHVLVFEPPEQKTKGHYQLVCAVPLIGQSNVCFEIYSSETGSWRCADTICVDLGCFSECVGFYMKGMVYWLMSEMKVLAFDLKNEVYDIIPLPFESSPCGGILTQIHDELCYVGISKTSVDNYTIEICSGYDLRLTQAINLQLGLEDKYTIEMCSDYESRFRQDINLQLGVYRILSCVEENELMILVGSAVYSYRLSDGEIEVISAEKGVEWPTMATFLPYVNSLVREV